MHTFRCLSLAVISIVLCAMPVFAEGPGNTDITWTDTATNELGFNLERHEGPCGQGTFAALAAPPKDAVSAKDLTTVVGKTYCFRISAWNNSQLDGSGSVQRSAWSNEAQVVYPLALPAVPGQLQAK